MKHLRLFVIVAVAAFVLAACGGDDDGAASSKDSARTVKIAMVDNAFEPDAVVVARGETVRFVFTNDGQVAHDAFVGNKDAQADHETEMREADDAGHGGHGGGESDAITVEPGKSKELTHTFDEAGAVEIGCHQPGHYAAGMKVTVTTT